MKRVLGIVVVLAAASVIAIAGTGASDGGSYLVRTIFDNASYVIPGEDVRIAGVNVGKVHSLDVTTDKKAVVVLQIDDPGFQDFRVDGFCQIRPQSLIGEKFVECKPTQPRQPGQPAAPKIEKIPEGEEGAGQYLLRQPGKPAVESTSSPVDIDLINNIFRLPYAQRFSLIINELGTGVAGRGAELREAIRRANPALEETDKVLNILADQNQVLADLARDSDAVLAPLARERGRVADFITQANTVARATAERRADFETTLERLPRFLAELRPTLARLGALSREATPVFEDLGAQAPAINQLIEQLGPFSEAATPALESLGEVAEIGGPALTRARPVIRQLRTFAQETEPVAEGLANTLVSLRDTGGLERVLDFIFYQVAAINGYDAVGHYLRAGLLVNLCSTYAVQPISGCEATFAPPSGSSASADTGTTDPYLKATEAALRGEPVPVAKPNENGEDHSAPPPKPAPKPKKPKGKGPIKLPEVPLPGRLGNVLGGARPGERAAPERNEPPPADAEAALFDYLMGTDE